MDWSKDYVGNLTDGLVSPSGDPVCAPLVRVSYIAKLVAEIAALRCKADMSEEIAGLMAELDNAQLEAECERDRANAAEAKIKELEGNLASKTVLANLYMQGKCYKPACADKEEDKHEHDSV